MVLANFSLAWYKTAAEPFYLMISKLSQQIMQIIDNGK